MMPTLTSTLIAALVDEALQAVADGRPPGAPPLSLPEGGVLFGPDGILASLEFVRFVLELETLLNERTGLDIVLVDERALSAGRSPFRSVAALVDWIRTREPA